jgi:hypothetical protein
MTSLVKISAHCADTKQVIVDVINKDGMIFALSKTLKNGETLDVFVYDDRSVTVREVDAPPSD